MRMLVMRLRMPLDAGQLSPACLTWSTPLTDDVLGVPADPYIRGLTLDDIVNSRVIARADNNVCSACHVEGSVRR